MSSNGDVAMSVPFEMNSSVSVDSSAQLLLTAREAAALCSRTLRTWRSWDAAGVIPRPVHIGRSTLWRVDELREWVAAGCPRRQEWESRQQE
jgi:predicted DNA-binding transcriptional regulator AlpA